MNRRISMTWRSWKLWSVAFADWLDRSVFFRIIEKLSRLSIVTALIVYITTYSDAKAERAWTAIYRATGQGGDGGRKDAVEYLTARSISLQGVDLSRAFLRQLEAPHADLFDATLDAANISSSNLQGANFARASLQGIYGVFANLSGANLWQADLRGADLNSVNLAGASLKEAVVDDAYFNNADLTGTGLTKQQVEVAYINMATKPPTDPPPDWWEGVRDASMARMALELAAQQAAAESAADR